MIAARCTPFGRSPLRNAVLICASVHEPIPVSLSCVILEAVTLNGGSSHESPLERSFSKLKAPPCPRGVWQFWQVMIVLTRYWPRSTGDCARAEPAAAIRAAAITTRANMRDSPKALPSTLFLVGPNRATENTDANKKRAA